MKRLESEILVVGAGPVGLALAGDLGWRGRDCMVLEQGDGVIEQPRMDLVGIRTMEFCRRWGIVADVESSAYDRDYPQDNVYLTALTGYELGRERFPAMRYEVSPPQSPQHRERCPQNLFDPILRKFAQSFDSVRLLYGARFVSFQQDERGVEALVETSSGAMTIRARFLVGCDGAGSRVRRQIGIDMSGRGLLTQTTNFLFRCPEFNTLHDKSPGYRYMFVGPDGVWATIVAINGRDIWRMSLIGSATAAPSLAPDDLMAAARRALGRSFDAEILSVLPWKRYELVADRYREDHVFLAGDSCHLTSPTGGLGMNTGIGDAVDLSWKLSAALEGWGGPVLLDSYEQERRPVAQRVTRFSTHNLQIMQSARSDARIFDTDPAGVAVRAQVGTALATGLKREWFSMNMHLGNRYCDSSICIGSEKIDIPNGATADPDAAPYVPQPLPGCRAPHVWLADGRSTLDLFGRRHVLLLCLDTDSAAALPLLRAARDTNMPLALEVSAEPDVLAAYGAGLVLVRPDGHIAWRGAPPTLAAARDIIQITSGYGRGVQASEAVSV